MSKRVKGHIAVRRTFSLNFQLSQISLVQRQPIPNRSIVGDIRLHHPEKSYAMNPENPYQSPLADLRPEPSHERVTQRTLLELLFSFKGRIPRSDYWAVTLGSGFIFYAIVFGFTTFFHEDSPVVPIVILLLYIPFIWISLAVQIKRWHDRDKSGFWIFIGIIPIIGPIWAFIEVGCLRGTYGTNQYGPDPLENVV